MCCSQVACNPGWQYDLLPRVVQTTRKHLNYTGKHFSLFNLHLPQIQQLANIVDYKYTHSVHNLVSIAAVGLSVFPFFSPFWKLRYWNIKRRRASRLGSGKRRKMRKVKWGDKEKKWERMEHGCGLEPCSDVTKTLVPRPRHQMKITLFTWSGNMYRKWGMVGLFRLLSVEYAQIPSLHLHREDFSGSSFTLTLVFCPYYLHPEMTLLLPDWDLQQYALDQLLEQNVSHLWFSTVC